MQTAVKMAEPSTNAFQHSMQKVIKEIQSNREMINSVFDDLEKELTDALTDSEIDASVLFEKFIVNQTEKIDAIHPELKKPGQSSLIKKKKGEKKCKYQNEADDNILHKYVGVGFIKDKTIIVIDQTSFKMKMVSMDGGTCLSEIPVDRKASMLQHG